MMVFGGLKIFTADTVKFQMEQREEWLGSMDPFGRHLLHEFFGL
jgi:hypothetical protein